MEKDIRFKPLCLLFDDNDCDSGKDLSLLKSVLEKIKHLRHEPLVVITGRPTNSFRTFNNIQNGIN